MKINTLVIPIATIRHRFADTTDQSTAPATAAGKIREGSPRGQKKRERWAIMSQLRAPAHTTNAVVCFAAYNGYLRTSLPVNQVMSCALAHDMFPTSLSEYKDADVF